MLYYLDDDNLINPNLYILLDIIDNNQIYTFNQSNRLKGNKPFVGIIDTGMCILPYNLCNNIRWVLNKYDADGIYIEECVNKNKNKHVYVNNDLCYYNKLTF